jgi:hypothetical protein
MEKHVVEGVEKNLLIHRKGSTRAFPPFHPSIPEDYQEIGQPILYDYSKLILIKNFFFSFEILILKGLEDQWELVRMFLLVLKKEWRQHLEVHVMGQVEI